MDYAVQKFQNDRDGDKIFDRATGPRLLNYCLEEIEYMYRERRQAFYDEALEVFKEDEEIVSRHLVNLIILNTYIFSFFHFSN
jgi:hypothetical protein